MSTLDPMESKWSLAALIVATFTGIGFPAYYIVANPQTKVDGKYVAVSPDAALIGGVLLVLCVIGFFALWKRKRTLLAFVLFLTGFALTQIHRALRIHVHLPGWFSPTQGLAHQQVRDDRFQGHPAGGRHTAPGTPAQGGWARSSSKSASTPAVKKPPTASKRYTPKSAPRKKIPKPTE